MKKYQVIFDKKALKILKKLDKNVNAMIINWIAKNLDNCKNPRSMGKALLGDKSGYWRYRIGNYRLVCEIRDKEILIIVIGVGHRKEIYK